MTYQRKNVKVRQMDGSYKWTTICAKTKRELTQKITAIQENAEREFQVSVQPTFSDAADQWFDFHRKKVSLYTANGYISPMNDLKEEFGLLSLSEIKPLAIQSFLNYLADCGLARQTIKLRLTVLKQIYDFAALNEWVSVNPAQFCKVPKNATSTKRELPTDEEIQKALDSVDLPFGLYYPFLYYTGCRRQEALALTYEDVDFDRKLIHINKKLIFDGVSPVLCEGAKSKKGERSIPLVTPLEKLLTGGTGLIFRGRNGYMTKPEFDKALEKYKKATGITATSHQFRHAFATLCFDAGLTDKDAAEVIGHANIETTRNIYTHIREQRSKAYADQLESAIKNAPKKARILKSL